MNKTLIVATAAIALALICGPRADASAFMTITVGASSATCNNSLAFSATNCGTGFTTVAGGGAITFTGTVGGFTFGGGSIDGIALTSNAPGSGALAFTLDTITGANHISGTDFAAINYGVNGFTLPTGLGTLSATQSGTMTMGAAGGTETFRSWERNDNALTAGPTGATAVSTTNPCTFAAAAPPVQACSGPTLTIGSPNVTAPFALTSEEILTTPVGSITSFTGTTALTATAVTTPEPTAVLLLGSGLLFLACGRKRNFGKNK